jgi:lipoprotein-releasing system permease protein
VPLILDIALTHLAGRGRQAVVAILGVAVGVGFSIAMAALMQGTQDDFIAQLVDTMPHVQITDETRTPRRQLAEEVFAAVRIAGLRPKEDRHGILNPTAALAVLRAWVPGKMAQSLKTQGVVRYAGRDVGATIIGIDPSTNPRCPRSPPTFAKAASRRSTSAETTSWSATAWPSGSERRSVRR